MWMQIGYNKHFADGKIFPETHSATVAQRSAHLRWFCMNNAPCMVRTQRICDAFNAAKWQHAIPYNYTSIVCVYRIGVVECDPFNSVHALHRMTAKLNYVPFATRIILNEFKNCVQWFENCSCVCECVLNAAENYVLTCSHLRTTFVIQHKLHAHGLSSAS